jgi:hypothetical protein
MCITSQIHPEVTKILRISCKKFCVFRPWHSKIGAKKRLKQLINFTHYFLGKAFLLIQNPKQVQYLKCQHRKYVKRTITITTMSKKIACKILVKLTPDLNFTNILCTSFLHESIVCTYIFGLYFFAKYYWRKN